MVARMRSSEISASSGSRVAVEAQALRAQRDLAEADSSPVT